MMAVIDGNAWPVETRREPRPLNKPKGRPQPKPQPPSKGGRTPKPTG